jgi:hypothetical protein
MCCTSQIETFHIHSEVIHMAENTEKTPKAELPMAPRSGDLPTPPANCEWDTTEVKGWRFAILVPSNVAGIVAMCKGDETLAVRKFSRALRIDAAAQLDARSKMVEAKDKSAAARDLQVEFLSFDPTVKAERAPRTPPTVTLVEGKKSYTAAEVQKMLEDAKVKVVKA